MEKCWEWLKIKLSALFCLFPSFLFYASFYLTLFQVYCSFFVFIIFFQVSQRSQHRSASLRSDWPSVVYQGFVKQWKDKLADNHQMLWVDISSKLKCQVTQNFAKLNAFPGKKNLYFFLFLSWFSWTANYSVLLLAENDLGIRKLEGGKYGTNF